MYEDLWMEKQDIEDTLESMTKGSSQELRDRLSQLYDILKIEGGRVIKFNDPLIAKWEQEIEEGLDPDLTEGLPDGWEDASY